MADEAMYTTADLVRIFSIHPQTARRMHKSGKLRGFKMGQAYRWRVKDVEAWIEKPNDEGKVA